MGVLENGQAELLLKEADRSGYTEPGMASHFLQNNGLHRMLFNIIFHPQGIMGAGRQHPCRLLHCSVHHITKGLH
ncbi:hypothetical protein D3C81_1931000 [compost metagenome]